MRPEFDDDAEELEEEPAPEKAERTRLRRAVERLGWTWVNRHTVEIPAVRELRLGPRTVVIRGRVPIDLPPELTQAHADAAVAPLVDPAVAQFQHGMTRAAARTLSEADDVAQRHVFERGSFFSALEDARRGLVQAYQALENKRVDEKVEAELGLRFYVQGFGSAERRLEYFVGPTNSGKTHAALELLAQARSGVYLAPLRLLALEVYERLRELGVAASLVTGEERVIEPGAEHVSSTVEMVDLQRPVEVAVIDEAQLLEDEQRGWAWTLAIAGVRAQHVVLCGSEDGLRAAQRLADRLGARIAVRRFERKNPLRVAPPVALPALRRGDAVVSFSRNAVVELQGEIGRLGFSSAAIYGSLSPAVRRREAERFRTGAADVLVATDAIGLGLNLPIRRIVFATVEKFDGTQTRLLTAQEVAQIAGRAGRYGIHEEGLVTTLDPRDLGVLRRAIERGATQIAEGPIWISPTDEHLRRLSTVIGTQRVSRLLQFFQTRVLRGDAGLRIADLSDQIEVAIALELADGFSELPFGVRCTYTRAPVTTRGHALGVLATWGAQHAADGAVDGRELLAGGATRDRLLFFEDRSRLATLYLWLAQRFPDVYANVEDVTEIRESIDEDIHTALLKRGARSKKKGPPSVRRRHAGAPRRKPR
ncbi:MAG TPA: helicase-related protein [Candidatus Limnocylindria bacterium]|nr:helicase-related protein [Candidatus Limnocylindria bacterium]